MIVHRYFRLARTPSAFYRIFVHFCPLSAAPTALCRCSTRAQAIRITCLRSRISWETQTLTQSLAVRLGQLHSDTRARAGAVLIFSVLFAHGETLTMWSPRLGQLHSDSRARARAVLIFSVLFAHGETRTMRSPRLGQLHSDTRARAGAVLIFSVLFAHGETRTVRSPRLGQLHSDT